MTPRVCLLVGDNHTAHCGVKDYALRLGKALVESGISAEVMAPSSWSAGDFLGFARHLRKQQFDIIHLQYPSIGHRASLWPHSIGKMKLARGCVVTLHEYSELPESQRLSTCLFRWTADQLIFTTETQMQCFGESRVPRHVVQIGSNVPQSPSVRPKNLDVLYFGQIRPDKGLEEFLSLASQSRQHARPFKFQIVGSVPERQLEYYHALRNQSNGDVEWAIDLSFDEIAKIMARSLAAYLPYPDGATYRRGSLLAAMTNGLPVLTRVGTYTPAELLPLVLSADSPCEALEQLEHLYRSPELADKLDSASRAFAERFSWTQIAQIHRQIYANVLSAGRTDAQSIPVDAEQRIVEQQKVRARG